MNLQNVNLGPNTKKLMQAVFAVFLIVCFTAPKLSGQAISGRILGSVLDSSGAAVPNAQITVTNQNTSVVQTTVTGADGLYTLPEVLAGTYTVGVAASGFGPAEIKDVIVTVGTDSRVDLKVQVGSITQSVTVTEAVPLVETTSSAVGGTVDEQRVADLPLNGRNWTALSLLQVGVMVINVIDNNAGDQSLFYSSNGGTTRSNAVTLDGANERNLNGFTEGSIISTNLGVDGIQEYKVVTNLFPAEYGGAMGSQTTIVSKGGTNQFHGDAYDYFRNSSLDARNFFDALDLNNANGFGTDKSAVFPGKRIPPFRRNDFGAALGGPIQKDKTFFYAVFEGIRANAGATVALQGMPKACFVDPSGAVHSLIPAQIDNTAVAVAGVAAANPFGVCAAGAGTVINVTPIMQNFTNLFPAANVVEPSFNYTFPFVQPESEEWGQGRVDHIFSAKDTAFFRWTQEDSDTVENPNYPSFPNTLHGAWTFVTLGENHVFSPTLLNTARVSVSRTWSAFLPSTPIPGPNAPLPSSRLILGQQFGSISPGGGVTGAGPFIAPEPYGQVIYTANDDLFLTKDKHSFKFGTSINYFYAAANVANDPGGAVTFPGLAQFFAGDYSQIALLKLGPQGNTFYNYRYIQAGFYAQDDYRVTRRLTLNLGLRYEFATVPIAANPNERYSLRYPLTDTTTTPGPIFQNPSYLSFSPRLGFAWDITGKGTTSLRGGGGIYYDIGNYGNYFIETDLATPPFADIAVISNTAPVPAIPLTLPLPTNFNATAPDSPKTNEFRIGEPTMFQYSLIGEQKLPWSMGLSIGYVGSRGIHLVQQGEGDPLVPVGKDALGRPTYGCWSAPAVAPATTPQVLSPTGLNANGSCPTGYTSTGPRQNPAWTQVLFTRTSADSWYNSLQVQVDKRISQGLQFQFDYTWSRYIDTGNEGVQVEGTLGTQSGFQDEKHERGPGSYDSPQNVRVNLLYHAPLLSSNGFMSKIANGWWFSSIVSAQEGYPFSPQVSLDRVLQNAAQVNERVNLGPNFNAKQDIEGKVSQWFDPTEFALQPAGQFGNAGRDILRGPGFVNVDASIVKDTKAAFLGEAGTIEFRTEFFNALNHPNFGLPSAVVYNGSGGATAATAPAGEIGSLPTLQPATTAGKITSTFGTSRQIQFALKLIF